MASDLPFTGERFVPGVGGNIFLEHMHRYVLAARFVHGKDVLDIASGEGFGSSLLAKAALSVVGVDIDDASVKHAQAKYATERLRFMTGSATEIPLPDASVDVVVSFETIEHIAEHDEMLAEVKRVLRPGGVMVMSTPDKATYSDASGHVNPFHVRELYRDEFHALLSSQFRHVRLHGQKIGFGSVVAAEAQSAPFFETDSASLTTKDGLATPMYLIGVASDDEAALFSMHGIFTQDIQSSDPVLRRMEYEEQRLLKDVSRSIAAEIDWISARVDALQRQRMVASGSWLTFLRRLIKSRILYALSRSTWLSSRRRKTLFRSAQKRDPVAIAAHIDTFCQDYFNHIKQNRYLADIQHQELIRHGVRITAIVPNFNHARYLRQRLDSILNQTYPLIDVLVLDDCSTDESRAVIDEYAKRYPQRITAVYNETNSGNVFRQWQKGYDLATGDFVWICESDDFCEPDFAERLIGAFRDPSVMLAFGKIEFADEHGSKILSMLSYLNDAERGIWGERVSRPAAQWFAGPFGVKNIIANVGGSMWRRVPLQASLWDEARSYSVMGDWFLYAALAQGGRIVFEPSAEAYFRIHGANTSGAGAQATPAYYEEYKRLMMALKRRWPIPDQTVDRFVESCAAVYASSGLTDPPLQHLLPTAEIKATGREMPHVLIGILGFSYGGGEIFPIHLANALRRNGAMVSILQMTTADDQPEVRKMLDPGIPVYGIETVRSMGGKAFMEATGTTVVHSHIASVEMVLLDEMSVTVPYLATLHGSHEAMGIAKRKLTAWGARIDCLAYTADRNLAAFGDTPGLASKVRKMRNAMPIDPRPYKNTRAEMGIGEDALVFTLVARGIEGKGWVEVVKAFKSLREKHPDVPMVLLGVGEGAQTELARQVAGSDGAIRFLGYDSYIHGIYRLSDVALVPTRFTGESYPLCLIQAMQVGVPAIATDNGEIASMMTRNGKNAGILIPNIADDDEFITVLCGTMEQMMDPHLRKRFGQDAAELGTDYSIDALARDYLALYSQLSKSVQRST